MEKDNNKNIELRSEEFQEILGRIPSRILRFGLSVIGVAMLIILIGCALFKYPDIVSTTMTLTGTYPPTSLVARTSGKIKEIYVVDKQEVKVGEYLAVIENPANQKDVSFLKQYLSQLNHSPHIEIPLPPKELILGSMQTIYSSLYTVLFEYNEFIRMQYYPQKIEYTQEKIVYLKRYYNSLIKQSEIVDEQSKISGKQYRRDFNLHKEGLISDENVETARSQELQGKLSTESLNSTIENTRVQITSMEESLLDMKNQYRDKQNNLEIQLNTYRNQLLTEIQSWEQNFVLAPPINGKVSFANYWAENQQVTTGDIVFHIVPVSEGKLMGKAIMAMNRSGKVKPGQKVNVRFLNFDDNEYGIIKGIVSKVSTVPVVEKTGGNRTSYYVVEIELPDGLKTTYNKVLPYLPEMEAQADIITKDISVLERLFMPLRKVWKEGFEN